MKLCDETITCFEPELWGIWWRAAVHEFYFKLPGNGTPRQSTMASPDVRVLSDTSAVVTYVRLTQKLDAQGAPVSVRAMETRVWQKQNGVWKHVHFHRTPC